MRLSAAAPAKINLCLFLGPPCPDGRHELVTLFESVSLADELILDTLEDGPDEVVCPTVEGPNLVASTLELLRARGWDAPPVRIEIVKRIPVAAGMGGGSADAAAALRLAVELAPGRPEEVAEIAAELGADVPSQLAPGLALGRGAGDLVEPFEPLAPHAVVVVPAEVPLATAEVYREADHLGLPRPEDELRRLDQELSGALSPGVRVPDHLVLNDLQPAAKSLCPGIGDALAALAECGAHRALVCGSGPTVFGLFWGEEALSAATLAASSLASRYPRALAVQPVPEGFGTPTDS